MHLRKSFGVVSIAFVFLCSAAGCGGNAPAPSAPAVDATPDGASSLAYFLEPSRKPAIDQAVQSAFVTSGFTFVADAATPHDVTFRIATTSAIERSAFVAPVNGVARVNVRTTMSLTAVLDDGRVVDQASVQFIAPMGQQPTSDQVRPLVTALRGSGRLAQVARDRAGAKETALRKQKAADEEAARQKVASDEADRKQREAQEEAAWQAANASTCAAATTVTACADLESWLKGHATSPHAAEAKQTLDAARPKITALADAASWDKANSLACKEPKKSTDCDGVEGYVAQYRDGAHVQEANALLASSRKKIEVLKKQEEYRAEAEARRQKAEELRACQQDCTSKDGYCRQSGAMRFDPRDFQDCSTKCLRRCAREVGNQ